MNNEEYRKVEDFLKKIPPKIPVPISRIIHKTNVDRKLIEIVLKDFPNANPDIEYNEEEGVVIRTPSTLSAVLTSIPRPTKEELEKAKRERWIIDLPPVEADMCKCGSSLPYLGGPCYKCNRELYEEYSRTGKRISRD